MELDDIQKKILIGCLEYEERIFIPVTSFQGVSFLCVKLNMSIDEEIEYLQMQNHWIADLIGTYLVRAEKNTYQLTEAGLKLAHHLRDEAQPANA